MIIFVYGSDVDVVRKKAIQHVEGLRAKRPDAGFFTMNDETFNEVQFEELIFGQGLFDKKFVVHLNRALQNSDAREFVVKHLDELAESENAFVISENTLTKPTCNKIEKVAYKTYVYDQKNAPKKNEGFNIFTLGDALGRRDRKGLWVLYSSAIRMGVEPAQIHGVLSSNVRTMALAARAESEGVSLEGSGVHPFALTKAKGALKNYSSDELEHISRRLVRMYHDSRAGGEDLKIALERFVLEL